MKKERSTEKRYKILCIGPLPPPVHGSSIMTDYLKNSAYINERIDIDWVNLSTSRKMEEIGRGSIKKIARFISSYLKTFGFLLKNRYDRCYLAITCHGAGFLKDAPFVLMCKMFGRKIIIHQHNKGMTADVDRPVFRWLLKRVYKDTKVILLSWKLYPDIQKIVDKDQITVCPNGIPDDVPHYYLRNHTRPVLLFLSNLLEGKGVITLLDACQILKEHGYDFECRFVGGDTIEIDKFRFNKERTSRGLDDHVVYAGRKYGEEKYQEFANADIFVFPTYYDNECFPVVILEAMQQSLPVVSTNEGGIADIIDDDKTGKIIPQKNPGKLAETLAELLDAPEKRKKLGRNGKEKYNSNYTLRKFEENMFACLTEDL